MGDRRGPHPRQPGVRDETGSDIFVGGVLNPGSGGIHPLNYLRGLADGVARRGVPIFQESPVVKLRRENGGVVAETPQGAVRAKQAIIATNSYSDLTSGDRASAAHADPVPQRA